MFDYFKKKPKPKKAPDYSALAMALAQMDQSNQQTMEAYAFPVLPDGVAPKEHQLAMDSQCQAMAGYAGLEPQFYSGFLGYPKLAQLAQSSEYRSVAETTAEEMTREWGKVKGGDDKVLEKIEQELERLNIRDLMRRHIEIDHLFGGSQMYIRIKGQDTEEKRSLPLLLTPQGVKKGSLEGFTVIEPIWTTPSVYNANDPTQPDYFKPTIWYVLGRKTHCDRLLTLIMRPVPDMLKPAYNFRGISMTQLMVPYVQRFNRTVDSVSDLIHTYSLTGIKTDMSAMLQGDLNGVSSLITRLQAFTKMRNNQGIMAVDKDGEEFFQLNTPLSTLDSLQDQSLQMLAMPAKIPLVKLLGTPPSGLSSNADGEIRVYYDHIAALQKAHILPQMQVILRLVQLSLFGKIDESIYFQFNPLYQLSEAEMATANAAKAAAAQTYVDMGALDPEEVRNSLAVDETCNFAIVDKDRVVEVDNYEDDPVDDEKGA